MPKHCPPDTVSSATPAQPRGSSGCSDAARDPDVRAAACEESAAGDPGARSGCAAADASDETDVCTTCGGASATGDSGAHVADGSNVSDEDVRDLIDAVAGATWSTRNRIMEERFLASLEKGNAKVPEFKPPGEAI